MEAGDMFTHLGIEYTIISIKDGEIKAHGLREGSGQPIMLVIKESDIED